MARQSYLKSLLTKQSFYQLVFTYTKMHRYIFQDFSQCAFCEWAMIWHGFRMPAVFIGLYSNMTTVLPNYTIAERF